MLPILPIKYIKITFIIEDPEPEDNRDRTKCWWCKKDTKIKNLFTGTYQICVECNK